MTAVIDLLNPIMGPFKRSGSSWMTAFCPFHKHRYRTPSFAINTRNGCWVCHSCGVKGTLPRLLRMLGYPRDRVTAMMNPLREQLETVIRREQFALAHRFEQDPYRASPALPEYMLGAYEYCPLDLVEKGFDPNLLESLDIGFDVGLQRITFPIRDLYGALAGIAGRTVTGDPIRYKVYTGGFQSSRGWVAGDFGPNFDEEFPGYHLDKGHFLWHGHEALPIAVEAPIHEPLIVVEGYKACLWLIQAGFPLTVALMGASLSTFQADLLRRLANPLVFFLDNNTAGYWGTRKAVWTLARSNHVRSVTYPAHATDQTQPDDLDNVTIGEMVHNAKTEGWSKRK